jgi:hypothetical protein
MKLAILVDNYSVVINFYLLYCVFDFIFIDLCQFRKAPQGSPRKVAAQKQVLEAMSHRMHIDDSVKLVGKLLFGMKKGPEVLTSVRPAGQPLVDDWDCLKTLVPFLTVHFVELVFLMLEEYDRITSFLFVINCVGHIVTLLLHVSKSSNSFESQ